MTDTHGTEPHDHESSQDEFLVHDQEAVHELPSDDEFADHSATVTEEHGEEQSASGAKAGHRSPVLPIVAAVGGILLLGAVAWWQFNGRTTSAQPIPLTVAATIPTPPPAPMASPTEPVTPTGPAASTSDILASMTATTPASSGSAPAQAPTPAPAAPSMGQAVSSPMAGINAANPAVAVPPGPTATPAPVDQRITALSSRIDDLQKSLDQTTQQLGQVTNMLSATAGSPSSKELQDRLDKIEQQLSSIHTSVPKLTTPNAMPSDIAVTANADSPKGTTKKKSHHTSTKAKSTHVAATRKPLPEAKPAPSTWVLRAASPGQAWVATSATAHDLKQVQVGDTLDGVGKVTAIVQNNGNWVVQGTKGTIQ